MNKQNNFLYNIVLVHYCIHMNLTKLYLEIKDYSPYQPKDD